MKAAGWIVASLVAAALPAAPARTETPPVYVVLFTHIEDNTPGGVLGSNPSRQNYLLNRGNLIAMAALAESAGVPWTLQPDWKILEAALLYEDSTLRATTNGKNFLRYLKEDRGVVIDPHSHESGGYNYTDVAHLLDSLGVGATTVIGGHVWDPSLPQFQEWDRFRVPVAGERYPGALWRGDILIGAGTPGHVNDPVVSGVWRPRDRDHFFEHDPAANIVAIGPWKRWVETLPELIDLRRRGGVPSTCMLTFSTNLRPSVLNAPGGLASIADTVIAPLVAWRDSGWVALTDFTALVGTWVTEYGAVGCIHDAAAPPVGVAASPGPAPDITLDAPSPVPFHTATTLRFALDRAARVRLAVFDILGREVAVLVDGPMEPGPHAVRWAAGPLPAGVYFARLEAFDAGGRPLRGAQSRRIARLR